MDNVDKYLCKAKTVLEALTRKEQRNEDGNAEHRLKIIINMLPTLFHDWDFDYTGFYLMLETKCRRMAKEISDNDRMMKSQRLARKLLISAELLRRLADDDYIDEYYEKQLAKWHKNRKEIPLKNGYVQVEFDNSPQINYSLDKCRERAQLRKQADKELLTKIFWNKIEQYWD